jgi:hypothetical protein
MIKRIPKYYLYQFVGWGLWLIVSWTTGLARMERIFVLIFSGLVATHLLRYVILRYGWLSLPVMKVWPRLLSGAVAASIVMGSLQRVHGYLFAGEVHEALSFFSLYVIDLLFLIGPWTMIYYFYHYADRVSQEASRNKMLEMRVKALEASFGEPGTDIDTMMETLQKIQHSIGEDPAECRREITEFSKLLRKGYLKTS